MTRKPNQILPAGRRERIARLLLDNREDHSNFWWWLKKGTRPQKQSANKFLLACILDFQMPAHVAWENARRLAEDILNNPKDLWECITKDSRSKWNSKWRTYSLHRYPKGHERVWRIGKDIVSEYDGDVRSIWKGQSSEVVLDRLNKMRVGEQISRMIAGALFDTGQITGALDVKVDIHVRKVLGRALRGREFEINETSEVIEETRKMNSENPWLLDQQLFLLGRDICTNSSPACDDCYLADDCKYYNEN